MSRPRSVDLRGLGLVGVAEDVFDVDVAGGVATGAGTSTRVSTGADEGIGLDEVASPIDPRRVSLPRPPTPVPEVIEHARWPPSPSHWPAIPPPPHWSTPPPSSPTPLSPPPRRRRPLSAQLEWMQIREPPPVRPSYSPLALAAELELESALLFRRASLPLPPRTPTLARRATTLPRSGLPRSPRHRSLARLSLPLPEFGTRFEERDSDPEADPTSDLLMIVTPERRRLATTPDIAGLESPIHIRETAHGAKAHCATPIDSVSGSASNHEGNEDSSHSHCDLAPPIHLLEPHVPTPPSPASASHTAPPSISAPAPAPAPTPPQPDTPPESRRRCPGLPFPELPDINELMRLLALLLVPVPLWLWWWQRGKLSATASVSSLGSLSTTSLSLIDEPEPEHDSSDESDDEGEVTIQAAWREPLTRRRSTSFSLGRGSVGVGSSPRRDSLAVPSLGGIPMSREASWDGSAYSSSRGVSPAGPGEAAASTPAPETGRAETPTAPATPAQAMPAMHARPARPPLSPPLVRRTNEGLFDW